MRGAEAGLVPGWPGSRGGPQGLPGPGPFSGPSVSILCRSPLGEPAHGGINSPPSGPLLPSLCWSCHDNQSHPDAKNTAKTTTKAPPSARRKEGKGQVLGQRQGRHVVRCSTLSTAPRKKHMWESGDPQPAGGRVGGAVFSSISRILPGNLHLSQQLLHSINLVRLHSGAAGQGQSGWCRARRTSCRFRRAQAPCLCLASAV